MRKIIPRWLHRIYAFIAGYYWARCPVCQRWYGGHETGSIGLPTGHCICNNPACDKAARDSWEQHLQSQAPVKLHVFMTSKGK